MARKLDTSTSAGGRTAVARTVFDVHLDECGDCRTKLCVVAENLWRTVVLSAIRQAGGK